MKRGMMVILAMLVLLAGCFNDGMKEKQSEAREKFAAFLDSMGNAEKTKRDAGDTQEGVYVTVGSELKFYSLENVLFTMTQTEKFALADQLEAASKIAEAKAHLVFGKFCLGFSDLMAGRDFNTPNLPLANTIIIRPNPTPVPVPVPIPAPTPLPTTGSWIVIVQQQDIYAGGLVYFGGSVSKDIVKITATVDGVAVTAVVQSRGSMSTTSSMTIRGQAVTVKKDAVLKVTGMNAAGAIIATATTLFEIKEKANPVPTPTPTPTPNPTPVPNTGSWISIVQQQEIHAGGLVYFGGLVSKEIVKITATVDGVAVTAVVQSRGSLSVASSMTIRGQAVTAKKDAVLKVTGMNAAGAVVATATSVFEIK